MDKTSYQLEAVSAATSTCLSGCGQMVKKREGLVSSLPTKDASFVVNPVISLEMGTGASRREPEVRVVVVQSTDDGRIDARVIRQQYKIFDHLLSSTQCTLVHQMKSSNSSSFPCSFTEEVPDPLRGSLGEEDVSESTVLAVSLPDLDSNFRWCCCWLLRRRGFAAGAGRG